MSANAGVSPIGCVIRVVVAGALLLLLTAAGILLFTGSANDRREKKAFEATEELAERFVAELLELAEREGFPRAETELTAISVLDVGVHYFAVEEERAILVIKVIQPYERLMSPVNGFVQRCFRSVFSGVDDLEIMKVDVKAYGRAGCPEM